MSKSLGNSPDPIDLMQKYGADGVRVGMLLCSAAGNDLLFDDQLVEQGRNFANKIWNAFRLVKSWQSSISIGQPVSAKTAITWFDSKLNETIRTLDLQFKDYRLSEALMTVYKLFWDEFSSWYLEIVKPVFGQPIDQSTLDSTVEFFDKLLRLLHPFMPFITEEIWQTLEQRKKGDSIMISVMPVSGKFDKDTLDNFEYSKQIITEIRTIRKEKNIPFKEAIKLNVKVDHSFKEEKIKGLDGFKEIIGKSVNLSEIEKVSEKVDGAVSFIVKAVEYYIPLGNLIDIKEEIAKISKELEYTKGFHESVLLKLQNEKFVKNAKPELVERERLKLAEAETKIKSLNERLSGLQKA
jgi:valyl-tRNA synthetase